jgi:hypothetical protein
MMQLTSSNSIRQVAGAAHFCRFFAGYIGDDDELSGTSVSLDRFIVHLIVWSGLSLKLEEVPGLRSEVSAA